MVKSIYLSTDGGIDAVEDKIDRGLLAKRVDNIVKKSLTIYEEGIIRFRFGLNDGRSRTLGEVGREFNVTRARIRQIEAKALRKLRHPEFSRELKAFW